MHILVFVSYVQSHSYSCFFRPLQSPVTCSVCVCDCREIDPESVIMIHRLCLPLPKGKMCYVSYAKSIITEWNHLLKWKWVTTTYMNGYVQVRVQSLITVWFACRVLNTSNVIRKCPPSLEREVLGENEMCHRELRGRCIQTYFTCKCHWVRAVVAREGTGIHNIMWSWPNHCPMWGIL
jgi:hypothetical protein